MEKTPKVSIVTVAYNAEKYLEETVKSVQAQTDPAWELLIRNNGSTDRTGEICERFAKEDARIHVIHNKVNKLSDDGFRNCQRGFWPTPTGQYTAILDSDDILHPDFVRLLYQKGEETAADVIIGGSVHFWDGNDPFHSELYREDILPEMHLCTREDISRGLPEVIYNLAKVLWGKAYRTNFWEQLYASYHPTSDHIRSNHHEDIFFGFHLLTQVHSIASVASPLYYYRRRKDSYYHTVSLEDTFQKRMPLCLYVYQYCAEHLEKAGFLTPRNAKCVYDIAAGLMLNLVRSAVYSDMNLSERKKFLKGIVAEPQFAEPYFFELSWKKYRPAFLNTLKPYDRELNKLDSWHDWMLRLYFAATAEETMPPYLEMLALYSAIFDRENINGFGIGELQHHRGRLPSCDKLLAWAEKTQNPSGILRRRAYCLKMLSGGFSIDMETEREKAKELLAQQDMERTLSTVDTLEQMIPFDPDVIYLHLLVFQSSGQEDMAYQTAACGHALYPEDEAFKRWLSEAKERRGLT